MSSQIRIVHRTGYAYSGAGAIASFNETRMTPRATREQVVLDTRVEISPTAWTHQYIDYWGTSVTAFEIRERHERMRVTASSTVDVDRAPQQPSTLSWEDLADPDRQDEFVEQLEIGARVDPGPELGAIAAQVRDESATPAEAVAELSRRVREHVRYVPGATRVRTNAAEAWAGGAGVCQDLAHLLIGALRSIGIPARYVSGYLMPDLNAEIGSPTVGETHAWVQYWGGSWIGVDPTTGGEPTNGHVEVAYGRDYRDVASLVGIFTGTGTSDMFVEVEMTRLT